MKGKGGRFPSRNPTETSELKTFLVEKILEFLEGHASHDHGIHRKDREGEKGGHVGNLILRPRVGFLEKILTSRLRQKKKN